MKMVLMTAQVCCQKVRWIGEQQICCNLLTEKENPCLGTLPGHAPIKLFMAAA